jgi:hypothetical protein
MRGELFLNRPRPRGNQSRGGMLTDLQSRGDCRFAEAVVCEVNYQKGKRRAGELYAGRPTAPFRREIAVDVKLVTSRIAVICVALANLWRAACMFRLAGKPNHPTTKQTTDTYRRRIAMKKILLAIAASVALVAAPLFTSSADAQVRVYAGRPYYGGYYYGNGYGGYGGYGNYYGNNYYRSYRPYYGNYGGYGNYYGRGYYGNGWGGYGGYGGYGYGRSGISIGGRGFGIGIGF